MKKLLCGAALALSSLMVNADALGVTVGAYLWSTEMTEGRLTAPTFNNFSISIDAEEANNGVLYIQWRHDYAYAPNLKASFNNIQHKGVGVVNAGGNSGSIPDGEVDMSHFDLIASWPLIDSAVRWEAGVMIRVLDGNTGGEINGGTTLSIPLSTTMALLYSSAEFELAPGIKAGIELMGGEYDNQEMLDGNIYASYTSPSGVGVNAGYRMMLSDIETEEATKGADVFASMDFKGAYTGLYYNF